MKIEKKIIVFLVEGISDKTALGLILSKLLNEENLHFVLTEGDISYKSGVSGNNAKKTVWSYVKKFLDNNHYKKSDIEKIVHIIDTDGAFVPDENVILSENKKTSYSLEHIYAKDDDAMKNRNSQKKKVVNCLCTTNKIAGVPYSIYYFSRNMEQVFYNEVKELTVSQKMSLSDAFEDKYADCPDQFIEYITNNNFAVSGEYCNTWNYIFESLNSLQKKSNLHLILK